MDPCQLYIVTGAPGAGKSTALDAFLALRTGAVAFDVDWLAGAASDLAGRSIYFDSSTWPAYGRVWGEILHGVHVNGLTAVLFAPFDDGDLSASGLPDRCAGVRWLLLDCADDVRTHRLRARSWSAARIDEALADAAALRAATDAAALPASTDAAALRAATSAGPDTTDRVDTGALDPAAVAERIADWLR